MIKHIGRLLALVLALNMILAGGITAFTQDAQPAFAGYEITETGTIDIIGATTTVYTHVKTGAQVVHIANYDAERAFVVSFKTPALDNKGIPHVFEHMTLGGSESYPSTALFFSIIYQTYNTGINASTYNSMTNYYYSTMSEDQLLLIADYYMDSVFHPLMYRDNMAFLREAWRYELADADAPLTVNGTVYNEMKGALDLPRAAQFNMLNALYPGSAAANESGGIPEHILTMTYEDCLAFHRAYYHPSNAMIFLYGDLDIEPFLALIGSYCDQYEKQDININNVAVTLDEPVTAVFEFPMEQSSEVKDNAVIYYAVNLGKLSPVEFSAFDILSEVLMKESSPIKSNLREVLPNARVSVKFSPTVAGSYLAVSAEGVNEADIDAFKAAIDAAYAEIAADGFDPELLEATIASAEFAVLSMPENSGLGVSVVSIMAWLGSTGMGYNYFNDYMTAVETAKNEYKNGYYEALIAERVVGNPHSVLVCTVPAPGLREVLDAAYSAELDAVKAAMSAEEIEEIIAVNEAFAEMANAEAPKELLDKLTAVTVETLPIEVKTYDIKGTSMDGIKVNIAETPGGGINMTSVDYNSAAVPAEDLHYLYLYSYLLGKVPTANYDLTTLQTKVARYLNQFSVISGTREFYDLSFKPIFNVQWYGLNGDYAEAVKLIREILLNTEFSDAELIAGYINQLRTTLKNEINNMPHSVMYNRALASRYDRFAYNVYMRGIAYYEFLAGVLEQIASDPGAFAAKMASVRGALSHKDGAVIMFAGNAEGVGLFEQNAGALYEHLADEPVIAAGLAGVPKPDDTEAVVIESAVQFNTVFASYEEIGMDYSDKLLPLADVISDAYLIPTVRYTIGAYGVFAVFDRHGMAFISYRDPSVAETFEAYAGISDFVAESGIAQEDIDRYIISTFANETIPEGELIGAINAMFNKYLGYPESYKADKLNAIKSVTESDLSALSEYLALAVANGYHSTAGSQAAIRENAEMYESILYPFGSETTD